MRRSAGFARRGARRYALGCETATFAGADRSGSLDAAPAGANHRSAKSRRHPAQPDTTRADAAADCYVAADRHINSGRNAPAHRHSGGSRHGCAGKPGRGDSGAG